MTYVSNIPREELAPVAPLSPEEAVPGDLLRLLAYGDAEAMAEVAGSMLVAEMAGELLAYRLSARADLRKVTDLTMKIIKPGHAQ